MFTKSAALVGAFLAGLSQASPVAELAPRGIPAVFQLAESWVDHTLFSGLAAPGLSLGISLPTAVVKGNIQVDVASSFLKDQTVKVDLGGLEAYFEVNLAASAAVSESIELVASEKLSLGVPGLLEAQIGAGFALDLVLGVSAAVDVSAGFYVKFPKGAFVEISIATKEVVKQELTGLEASVLDIGVGVGVDLSVAVELSVALRLRSEIAIGAGVNLLGLEIGAGLDVAVWIGLFDYTTILIQTGSCPGLSISEKVGLTVGIAVELDVAVAGLLELSLAPTVVVSIAAALDLDVKTCLPTLPPLGGSHGGSGSGGSGGSGSGSNGNGTDTGSHGHEGGNGGSGSGSSPTEGGDYVTSTVYQTQTYTITSCYASVPNCPATYTQKVVTVVTTSSVTVCPATQTGIYPTSTPSSTYETVPTPTSVTTITLTTCPVPETTTYTPAPECPTPVPTTTITETYPEQPTYPAQPPHSASASYPASTPTYPASQPPASYPAGGPAPSYPAGGPAPSYPVGTGSYKPAPAPTGGYPAITPKPSAYPTYPASSPVTAGAGRVFGSSLAAAVALVAAALML